MTKIKAMMQAALSAMVALFCIIVVVLMVCVMMVWTVGLFYFITQGGCTVEVGSLVCDLG